MYRDRLIDLKRDNQIRDILIARHHKKPGVAVHHPYSRVTAIPIVFDETRRELREARDYYQYKRRCLYCDMLRQEIAAGERLVRLTPSFAVLVPYAPRVPLETWIVPRQHACSYEESLSAATARDLANLLAEYFRTLVTGFDDKWGYTGRPQWITGARTYAAADAFSRQLLPEIGVRRDRLRGENEAREAAAARFKK